MSNPYQFQQYQQQQVFTAPPDKLLLMLFDGAIRFCKLAKKALANNNIEESHRYLTKAEDILVELMTSLNMDYEFSSNLYSLYDYLYRQLVEANLKKDEAPLDEVLEFLTELRQTWAEVAAKARESRKIVVGGGGLEG
ncbi:MAG: flagellar export chaperone FliS [Clostridia bacterium]|jgi:flagellar protein FliS|nr:flagellar export chaperone FliS [Clostridia bacterium]